MVLYFVWLYGALLGLTHLKVGDFHVKYFAVGAFLTYFVYRYVWICHPLLLGVYDRLCHLC
jgi:hypothetical protein